MAGSGDKFGAVYRRYLNMTRLTFKDFLEARDIFGFDAEKPKDPSEDSMLDKPIHQFNIELMMDILGKKKIGNHRAIPHFVNEIRWGGEPGAVKLEVDTGFTFYVKKLGKDMQGNERWCSKKVLQLNRQGYGSTEDTVAEEIHGHLKNAFESQLESPKADYDDLENLVVNIYNKAKKVAKSIFIPEGIRRLSDNAYIIRMGVRGQGCERQGHMRVEQNQLLVSHDPQCGTIRISNYNIESPVGGPHSWKIQPSDFDIYVFPTQGRDEISEMVSVHYKYY